MSFKNIFVWVLAIVAAIVIGVIVHKFGVSRESIATLMGINIAQVRIIEVTFLMLLLICYQYQLDWQTDTIIRIERKIYILLGTVFAVSVIAPLSESPFGIPSAISILLAFFACSDKKQVALIAAFLYICSMGTLFFFV